LQHTAALCHKLQHTATHCNTPLEPSQWSSELTFEKFYLLTKAGAEQQNKSQEHITYFFSSHDIYLLAESLHLIVMDFVESLLKKEGVLNSHEILQFWQIAQE